MTITYISNAQQGFVSDLIQRLEKTDDKSPVEKITINPGQYGVSVEKNSFTFSVKYTSFKTVLNHRYLLYFIEDFSRQLKDTVVFYFGEITSGTFTATKIEIVKGSAVALVFHQIISCLHLESVTPNPYLAADLQKVCYLDQNDV